jgi:carbon-monoxide dehydrogenase medium subunit
MKPAPFEYHAPATAAEAVGLLAELGDGAKVLAGGQSLVPILALRLSAFDHLVDVSRVEELHGIAAANGGVRIGAATTQRAVERSVDIANTVPLLARATPFIGHFQIRNRGTVGGSIAHADPAAEYPAVALALDAQLEILSSRGARTVGAGEFFLGMWTTAVGDDELLTAITFPRWEGRCGFAIEELAQRHGDFALAGACVAVALGGGDQVERCAISLFGLGPTPVRARVAETMAMRGDASADELGRAAVADLDEIPSDMHGSADYRRHAGAVMVARAWQRAMADATDG